MTRAADASRSAAEPGRDPTRGAAPSGPLRLLPLPPAGSRSKRARPAVFIDKDGTLVEDVPYNVDPALVRFTPGAEVALRRLAAAGYPLIVISNQPGLALGRFRLDDLKRLASEIAARLATAGVPLAGFYACPHAPAAGGRPACGCRKPAPGLLRLAARQHGIAPERAWMVGDILDDIEAGWRAGCRTVLLDVGNETVWRAAPSRVPTFRVADLAAAADAILDAPGRLPRSRPPRRAALRRPSACSRTARPPIPSSGAA